LLDSAACKLVQISNSITAETTDETTDYYHFLKKYENILSFWYFGNPIWRRHSL